MFSTLESTVNSPIHLTDLPTLKMSVKIPVYIFCPPLSSFFLVRIQEMQTFLILAQAKL